MTYDLIIVGAGPAGMAAAAQAAERGLSILVLDEQPRPGGQIYRNIETTSSRLRDLLGPDYQAGDALVSAFRNSRLEYLEQAVVWQLNAAGEVCFSRRGHSYQAQGKHILLATGAQERPFPVKGWQLPGVMTAGAAQILLKSPGLACDDAVFVGSGPLLYLIVWQYLQAGKTVKALIDTTPRRHYFTGLGKLPAARHGIGYLWKGLNMIRAIRQAGIPFISGVEAVEIEGEQSCSGVRWQRNGQWQALPTSQVFLHQGVVPNVNLAMASGCEHHWSPLQACWQPVTDEWGQSNLERVSLAGDGMGIGGAKAAALRGQLAALQIACRQQRLDNAERDRQAAPLRQWLDKELAFRPFLDTLYRPADRFRAPEDGATLVCRCESVTRQAVADAAAAGCMGPNQLKSFSRCGMGPCQGRQCGLTVSELMAQLQQQPPEATGYYRLRAPVKPVQLAELASLSPWPAQS
ncbi:FAD/NAD(P)-dependent oxidoreductase [Marinobacterium arenosum]|uniref:FAD/NAD(P)-dependent oxidoreductase n=1 Tax=Marinobacterium arenosum TaxID=2862496 RepID=UPI001C97B712|nr:NAD(P)/FAD-dependent oxidoreductase [Marinobacterium arenosum]MBY4676178.1 NAD(P)/FAD-dependent oxidoreductase [Marinobacterium arenosum]